MRQGKRREAWDVLWVLLTEWREEATSHRVDTGGSGPPVLAGESLWALAAC